MTQITLTADRLRTVQEAKDPVEIRDRHGNLLGYVSRLPSEAEIAEARRRSRSDGPWYTTEQVLNHLDSLEQG